MLWLKSPPNISPRRWGWLLLESSRGMYPEILRHGGGSTANTAGGNSKSNRKTQLVPLVPGRFKDWPWTLCLLVHHWHVRQVKVSVSRRDWPWEQPSPWHHVGFWSHSQAVHSEGSYSGYACSQQATYLPWITDEVGTTCWALPKWTGTSSIAFHGNVWHFSHDPTALECPGPCGDDDVEVGRTACRSQKET